MTRTIRTDEPSAPAAGKATLPSPFSLGSTYGWSGAAIANRLPTAAPVVESRELDARTLEDHTIREGVDAPGVRYVPVDGDSCGPWPPQWCGHPTYESHGARPRAAA